MPLRLTEVRHILTFFSRANIKVNTQVSLRVSHKREVTTQLDKEQTEKREKK